jgi:hypothetical protein
VRPITEDLMSNSPLPFALDVPLPIATAIDAFRAYAAHTRNYPGVGRPPRVISPISERVTLSSVYSGLCHLTGIADHERLGDLDLRPLLPDLPRAARDACAHHACPSDAASRVRRFIEHLTGRRPGNHMHRPEQFLGEAWAPLIAAAACLRAPVSRLLLISRASQAMGVLDAPANLPGYTELREGLRRCGLQPDGLAHACTTYRRCRAEALRRNPSLALADLPVQVTPRSTLGDVTLERVADIAPRLARQLEAYLEKGPGVMRSPSWRRDCEYAIRRVVAALLRAGREDVLPTLSVIDLVECTVRVEAELGAIGDWEREMIAATPEVTLLQWLLDREAPNARGRSPFAPRTGYTEAQHRDVVVLGSILRGTHLAVREHAPARWAPVEARYVALERHVRARLTPTEDRAGKEKDKALFIRQLTYPLVVCVGLPAFRRVRVLPARARWLDAQAAASAAGHGPDHPRVVAALKSYAAVLEAYLVTAIAIDDGMRIRQYTHGVWQGHFVPTYAGETLTRVDVTWGSQLDDPACVKVRELNDAPAKRERRALRPGIVDFALLDEYVRVIRAARLSRRGIDPANAALFVSPRSRRATRRRGPTAGGAYRGPTLSQTIGRTLHWIARDVLGRDVPAWGQLGPKWRALWSAHVTRLLVVSYRGGVRGDWREVEYVTMDREPTARAEYMVVDDLVREARLADPTHWEHPHAYDRWIDRIYAFDRLDPLDDPELPLPEVTRDLLMAATESGEGHSQRPRLRRARPGQPPPPSTPDYGGTRRTLRVSGETAH